MPLLIYGIYFDHYFTSFEIVHDGRGCVRLEYMPEKLITLNYSSYILIFSYCKVLITNSAILKVWSHR